jgi:hypothetical protein
VRGMASCSGSSPFQGDDAGTRQSYRPDVQVASLSAAEDIRSMSRSAQDVRSLRYSAIFIIEAAISLIQHELYPSLKSAQWVPQSMGRKGHTFFFPL